MARHERFWPAVRRTNDLDGPGTPGACRGVADL